MTIMKLDLATLVPMSTESCEAPCYTFKLCISIVRSKPFFILYIHFISFGKRSLQMI